LPPLIKGPLLPSSLTVTGPTYGVKWVYETSDESCDNLFNAPADELPEELDELPDAVTPAATAVSCAGGLWWGTAWGVGKGPLPTLTGMTVLTGRRGWGCLGDAPMG